jgi:hypothetical protein
MADDSEDNLPSPWRTGSPAPWILKIFGGPPSGLSQWLTRAVLALAVLSLGLFTVTRLMLIHWVFLVPASLGSLLALGTLYVILEMRRPPVAVLEIRPDSLVVRRPGREEEVLSLDAVALREIPGEYRFEIVRMPEESVALSVAREAVRDVSLYETIRRFLSLPPFRRPPVPVATSSRSRFYRWFILSWSLIIMIMILWALSENYAAPRSYEPFCNP